MEQKKTILLTGGLGYIGSHTCIELLKDYNIIIIDNLSNSKLDVIDDIKKIHPTLSKNFITYTIDLLDSSSLLEIFEKYNIYSVIHFAGLKSVSESIVNPGLYYKTNLIATINLLEAMYQHNCDNLIFSSSATVYGEQPSPLKESDPTGKGITNPYGRTKYFIETMNDARQFSKDQIDAEKVD